MQAAGWIVIILFGFIFALLAVFLVRQLLPRACQCHSHGICDACEDVNMLILQHVWLDCLPAC